MQKMSARRPQSDCSIFTQPSAQETMCVSFKRIGVGTLVTGEQKVPQENSAIPVVFVFW
jgi:hypothetical protein